MELVAQRECVKPDAFASERRVFSVKRSVYNGQSDILTAGHLSRRELSNSVLGATESQEPFWEANILKPTR